MIDTILVLDFGSQYTQLIARRLRELEVYSEIIAYNKPIPTGSHIKGIILSGGPASVFEPNSPKINLKQLEGKVPVLGICYGAQLMVHYYGGKVEASNKREYGDASLLIKQDSQLFYGVQDVSKVWMSHGDTIMQLPPDFVTIGTTEHIPIAAFESLTKQFYGLQFHPEVTHSIHGKEIIQNFIFKICRAKASWTPIAFIESTIEEIQNTVGNNGVICALSGGVDSTVAATLIHKAIGNKLHCVFVNNGLLRKNEYEEVNTAYNKIGLNLHNVDASEYFLNLLSNVTEPEKKRKIIGNAFIDIFNKESQKIEGIQFLAQGTIYPDVIESVSIHGPSAVIKSHHNVGGLPEKMHLKLVEPLRNLFKDEVRRVGFALGIPESLIGRHPFPGPGLAIRILGEITPNRIRLLQDADVIFINALKKHNLYNDVWQAFCVLLPVNSVGVMGDQRTYENVLALRAVTSTDGMTAEWAPLPHDFLAKVSNEIINNVRGINRVVYDISSKPPATIEWE